MKNLLLSNNAFTADAYAHDSNMKLFIESLSYFTCPINIASNLQSIHQEINSSNLQIQSVEIDRLLYLLKPMPYIFI